MEFICLSSLEKVFSDERPSAKEFTGFSMLKNERSSFQIAVLSEKDAKLKFSLGGALAPFASVFAVREVPVSLPCFDNVDDYYLRKEPGMYPDVLEPAADTFTLTAGKWQSLWIEIAPQGDFSGSDKLTVSFSGDGIEKVISVDVEVIDASLPKQTLVHTNWYHSDCLCNYYGIEPFSDEYWRINKNFISAAVKHGVNCILTPLFTPPLDTAVGGERTTVQLVGVKLSGGGYRFDFRNLSKWIAMCRECGVEYYEMSHLFTQWGAKHAPKIVAEDRKGREKKIFGWSTRTSSKKYDKFLRAFAKALVPFLEKEGIASKCFFHVSDEPSERHLKIYKKRSELISEIFPGFPVIDALSDFSFYETGAVKQPIPCENNTEEFAGKVPELWTYYCCGQGRENVPNRFMAMPSLRNRILGLIMYQYDIKGFLQWGYNFYSTQYSRKAIDPYEITDAGHAFPSGDSFVVYPAKDGTAVISLRFKVFYDGFQDMMALQLLESKLGREKALEAVGEKLSFRDYPQDASWLLETREKINKLIKENM